MESFLAKIKSVYVSMGLGQFNSTHLYFMVGTTLGVFLIEMLFTGWDKCALKRVFQFEKTTRTDLTFWLLETFNFYNIIAVTISFGICYYLVGVIQKNFAINLMVKVENQLLAFALIYIISDFKNYVRHYIFHRSNTLWQLHQLHHSATDLNILARQRGHFLEAEISRFFDVIPLILLGAPVYTYFAIKVVSEAHQMLVHSSLTSGWGFLGKYIIVSPAAHRIHHSIDEKHYNKNLGSTFIFWDRLFKTYHPDVPVYEIGIPENPYNRKGYVHDIFLSMYLFYKNLVIKILPRKWSQKLFVKNFPKTTIFDEV